MEPPHLKSNACEYFFKAVLREAIRKSKLPANCKKFSELPSESPFAQVITALPTEVKTNRPANKTNSDSIKHKGLELNCIIDLLEKIAAVFVITFKQFLL